MKHEAGVLRWAAVAAWAACIFIASSMPSRDLPSWASWLPGRDKLAHAAVYSVLCLLALRALTPRGHRPSPRRVLVALVVIVLYGLSDEVHQLFVETRSFDLLDLAADAAGAAAVGWTWPRSLNRWPILNE